jgi:hypothetical protein
MSLSRRSAVKLGLAAGAAPLLSGLPLDVARAWPPPPATRAAAGGRVQARTIPLARVRLTGGPLQHAQDLDRDYLLVLEPDRMLAYYRERAGLAPKAEPYGGWDGGGRNLTGHIAGHYLSAVSLMWAATGDGRFKDRADYVVRELKVVQDKNGGGYLCALEHGRDCFAALARGDIRAAPFDLNGEWSPWYTLHKLFAGLRDAYRHTGNRAALAVETGMAQWAAGILSRLDDDRLQHMLAPAVVCLRAPRLHPAAAARPGRPGGQARELLRAQAHRLGAAVHRHRTPRGPDGRDLFLEPRGRPP